MKRWFLKWWFLLGLGAVVALAFLAPGPGAPGGLLRADTTARAAVVVIFLVQGLVLALESLRAGLLRWRLHLVVQGFTYLLIPLLGLALDAAVGRHLPPDLRLGFLFLAVLPTTVSTAIVFTSLAGGNTAGALVNAALSNVLGVVVTPLWVGALVEVRGERMDVWPLIGQIAWLVLAPLLAGQLLRLVARRRIDAHKTKAGNLNSLLVLFIVYTAFCGSVKDGVFLEHGWRPALVALTGSLLLFAIVMGLVELAARLVRLPEEDRIAAWFCAPQKTLAAGVPMAKLLFTGNPALGLILLPVMFYHPVQLLIGGLLVNRFKRRSHEAQAVRSAPAAAPAPSQGDGRPQAPTRVARRDG